MINLQEAETGRTYKVTWMIGELAEKIRKDFDLHESDDIQIVQNMGKTGVIIRYGTHRVAMDPSAAFAVKAEPDL